MDKEVFYPGIVDIIFENVIVDKDGFYYVIDSEWVFDEGIPCNFLLYRTFFYFYIKNSDILRNVYKNFEDLLKIFHISEEENDIFSKVEKKFQYFVNGNRLNSLRINFLKEVRSIEWLENQLLIKNNQIEEQRRKIEEQEKEIIGCVTSKSWKITRPLRQTKRYLKKFLKIILRRK